MNCKTSFSPSSSSDKSVKVWDASSRACINTFFDHQDQVTNPSASPMNVFHNQFQSEKDPSAVGADVLKEMNVANVTEQPFT